MARINTAQMLSNEGYFSGVDYSADFSNLPMTVASEVSDWYDYALTEDIVLLNERNLTRQILNDIWLESPYSKVYKATLIPGKNPGDPNSIDNVKIPKEDINKIFYYMKNKLLEKVSLSAYETVIAINEFFDFNYDYVVKKVLSPKIKAEIYADYYKNGMKDRIDDNASVKLF